MLIGPSANRTSASAVNGTPPPRGDGTRSVEGLSIGTRAVFEEHADGYQPVAGIEFASAGPTFGRWSDANGLRQALGRYAEPHGQVATRVDAQLRD